MADEVANSTSSRRRFLAVSATLASSLAGCSGTAPEPTPPNQGNDEYEQVTEAYDPSPTRTEPNTDDTDDGHIGPPAIFSAKDADQSTLRPRDFPRYHTASDWDADERAPYDIPNWYAVQFVSLNANEATVEFDATVEHPFTVAIHLTNATLGDPDRSPGFHTNNTRVVERAIEPTSGDEPETHRLTFDLSTVAVPHHVNTDAYLLVEGPTDGEHRSFRLTDHERIVPIPYTLPDGEERIIQLDKRDLSPQYGGAPGISRQIAAFDQTSPTNGTTLTYACIEKGTTGDFWGVAVATDDQEMAEYTSTADAGTAHSLEAMSDAPDDPFMVRLARDLRTAHTRAGIVDPLDRLNAAAEFVQRLPYKATDEEHKPLHCLHKFEADCSERTTLYGGILACEPYETRLVTIYCELKTPDGWGKHLVGGVDMDALANSDGNIDDIETVRPDDDAPARDGIPEKDYAFIELTNHRKSLGDYDPQSYNLEAMWVTNRREGSYW